MELSTSIEKNSVFNLQTTDRKETLQKDKVIISALYDSVQKRLKELKDTDTITNHASPENNLHQIEKKQIRPFEIPEFSKDFFNYDRQKYFSKTQKWVGYILGVNGDTITARLNDLNNPNTYEIADFEIRDVPYEDRELISLGAGFYWSVGYVNDNGQIEKKSLIRFKRTIAWDETDVDRIKTNADNLYNKLNDWE